VADQSYLPALLERDELVDGNANLQISQSVAQIGGPTLGGNLIAVVAAPFAILIDALSFFVSGGFISAIKRREEPPMRRIGPSGRPAPLRSEIAEGLRYVLGHSYLRPIAACTGTSNLFGAALFSIFPVLIWQELKLPPAFYGTVMGLASVGFLAGAGLSSRLPKRIGIGRTILVSAAFAAPAFLLIALTPENLGLAAVTLFVGWFVAGMTQVIYNVAQISLRQAITPPEMQSRMNATMRFIVWGTIPIGSLLGGVMATFVPVRVALIFAALASSLAVLPVLASPLRSLRDIPGEPQGPVADPGTPSLLAGGTLSTNEAGLP
jgi:hypothetical protein